ncbi:MAG: hypothetical protein Q7J78_00620, partial [Clostridiales bacterium]|nr:hypothetical protein [Clostridiales bacterium]
MYENSRISALYEMNNLKRMGAIKVAVAAYKNTGKEIKQIAKGIAFIGPSYLGFILFTLLPVFFALILA